MFGLVGSTATSENERLSAGIGVAELVVNGSFVESMRFFQVWPPSVDRQIPLPLTGGFMGKALGSWAVTSPTAAYRISLVWSFGSVVITTSLLTTAPASAWPNGWVTVNVVA